MIFSSADKNGRKFETVDDIGDYCFHARNTIDIKDIKKL